MTCHHEILPNDILKNDSDESHALHVNSNSFKNDFQDIQQNCLKQNDIQQNDIQLNDIQQNDIQQNDIQQNDIHQNDV